MLRKLFAATITLLTLSGCNELSREELLARVAKDWSLTIRASQVIPVYPLTEDLQPGDILLVNKTQSEEIKVWQEKGFLPLERHIGRLNLTKQSKSPVNLYNETYREWGDIDKLDNGSLLSALRRDTSALVPLAGFPSYSFSIQRNTSLGFALPLQGIPFGLSFLNTDNAFGSVVMKDAFTVGLPEIVLDEPIREWFNNFKANSILRTKDEPTYLRLITRVYLAKDFTVSLSSNQGNGTVIDAGSGGPSTQGLTDNLNRLLNAPSKPNADGSNGSSPSTSPNPTPSFGGTLKVLYASANSIALENKFPRPVVIGYRAVDYPIGSIENLSSATSITNIGLGAPEDTFSKFEGQSFRFENAPDCQKISTWLDFNKEGLNELTKWSSKNGRLSLSDIIGGKKPELCSRAVRDLKIN